MFRIEILILTIVFLLVSVLSYRPNVSLLRSRYGITTRKMTRETNFETSTFTVGSDVPPEIAKHVCIHDMILVERYSSPRTTASGLIVSATEGKEKKQLGKVLSIPNYGIESAQGKLTPINDIAPYKVGDQVFVKVRNSNILTLI